MTTPVITDFKYRFIAAGYACILAVFLLWPGAAFADAASIAQGYTTTDTDLAIGMAAAVSANVSGDSQSVERAGVSNSTKFVGIVTTKDANLVTLTSTKSTVVVATSGDTTSYLTDVNGPIKHGDAVVISPIKGVLMKASSSDTAVLGTALEDVSFGHAAETTLSLSNGKTQIAHIASGRIELNSRSIGNANGPTEKSFLQIAGEGLTGRPLSQWQVLASLVIFVVLLITEASLIYGAVHGTLSALGRNPLAKDAVYKQLVQVLLAVMAILAFGMAVIYAILQV